MIWAKYPEVSDSGLKRQKERLLHSSELQLCFVESSLFRASIKTVLYCYKKNHIVNYSIQLVSHWPPCCWSCIYFGKLRKRRSGVRFSKDPKTSRTRKLFGAVFGRVSRVPESVSQSARFSPEIFGDVSGKCNARNSASFNFPVCDWFKNCN